MGKSPLLRAVLHKGFAVTATEVWDPTKFVKYEAKTAAEASPAFYHLSRRTNRGSIKAKGLLPMIKEYKDLKRRPGVFFFKAEDMAKNYGFYFAQYINQAVDVWEVRLPDGYKISPDTHPDMEGFNAWVGYDSVPPENLRFVVDTVLVPTSKSEPTQVKSAAEEHEDSFYWFEPGFPEDARKFVMANKDQGRTEFCEKESRAWASRLAAAGFPVELVKGDYPRHARRRAGGGALVGGGRRQDIRPDRDPVRRRQARARHVR
jgi:hypothetical protein